MCALESLCLADHVEEGQVEEERKPGRELASPEQSGQDDLERWLQGQGWLG